MRPEATSEHPGRYAEAIEALRAAILVGPGVVPPSAREAAASGETGLERFGAFVDAIHRHAYRITDETVAELQASGATEDEVFEITVAAAYGAARERLEAGLRALASARDRD